MKELAAVTILVAKFDKMTCPLFLRGVVQFMSFIHIVTDFGFKPDVCFFDDSGDLLYSLRVTSTIACSMQLNRYPFDVQNCEVLFESCKYATYIVFFIVNVN